MSQKNAFGNGVEERGGQVSRLGRVREELTNINNL